MPRMATASDEIRVDLDAGTMKRAHRDQRKSSKREARAQRRRQIRCWWSWPLRHEYATLGDDCTRCVGCGKPQV